MEEERSTKRRRLLGTDAEEAAHPGPASLTRDISPPPRRVDTPTHAREVDGNQKDENSETHEHSKSIPPEPGQPPARETPAKEHPQVEAGHEAAHQKLIPSPFQLTTIRDLPPQSNAGAVSLHDLLGDPLISECWEFNYLHNIEFLMSHFDEDVRALVKIHVVHGNWKREDPSRLALEEEASRHKNITLHTAYMPEPFGTHHSKMLILFRHDDTAQVIIHTANMIAKDWTNMTNAVWQSPSLPLSNTTDHGQPDAAIGTGEKFKADIMSYLRAYNKQRNVCRALVDNLSKYDFSAVRGALIASVPGRHPVNDHPSVTRWGWTAMKHALRCVPVQQGRSEVVVQISSIATLGGTDTWIQKTLFDSLSSSGKSSTKPELKIIFPTPDEISRSLDGYASGGSIHTKIQSAQQQKQLVYLRPVFCHWANDAAAGLPTDGPSSKLGQRDGGRQRAAPHIKTYIRYNSSNTLDWALFTSANISKQAWGEAANGVKEVRIASWEIGVLVWPELLAGGEPGAQMVGVFRKDEPIADDLVKADVQSEGTGGGTTTLVGLRIPYSLPLKKYGPTEKPWVATADYQEPDWKGQRWVSWAV